MKTFQGQVTRSPSTLMNENPVAACRSRVKRYESLHYCDSTILKYLICIYTQYGVGSPFECSAAAGWHLRHLFEALPSSLIPPIGAGWHSKGSNNTAHQVSDFISPRLQYSHLFIIMNTFVLNTVSQAL